MSRSMCYVVSRHDGFWYAVVGGRDLGRFTRREDAEAFAASVAASHRLPRVTTHARPEVASGH